MAKTAHRARVGRREVELTNLDKPLWPESGITKADYIHYIHTVAHLLLPQLEGRPLTVTRYPDGVGAPGFYQKDCPDYAPEWIETYAVTSPETGKVTRYIVPREPADLIWLANQAAIEFHPWMSRAASPGRPDYCVIDLDPAEGATFDDVKQVAGAVREVLEHLGLAGFPKLSGATGIHVYVPLQPKYSYAASRTVAGYIARVIARALPDKATDERRVKHRGPRVYVDHLQNLPGKTIVAAFSARPLPGAPVSAPFDWAELESLDDPSRFTLNDLDALLARPSFFHRLERSRQDIGPLLSRLELSEF